MAETRQAPAQAVKHQLVLKGRRHLEIHGVTGVQSFEEDEMILQTDAGVLVIRGEGMQILALDVEEGTMGIAGLVHSLVYARDSAGRRAFGLLGRLMR